MKFELDHLFVCTERGAPEGDELVQLGLREGTPNRHPGQGTANRRFPLLNAMIELVWVDDAAEAQSENTRRTLLWERWSGRKERSCPFGICVRPVGDSTDEVPFPGWAYRPSYLTEPLYLHIGDAGVWEPMWVYLGFLRRADREKHFAENALGVREITGLTLITPTALASDAAQAMLKNGVLVERTGDDYLLEIEFDKRRSGQTKDLRPRLPLVFHF
jgi:hypothetical protein